jgi:hypothetical protein
VFYDSDVSLASVRDAAIVFLVPVILYLSSGAANAYLANDDFNWLNDARTKGVSEVFHVAGRSHFYRPLIETWFTAMVRVCGDHSSCYHLVTLIVHGLNGVLLYLVSARAFGRRDLALTAASVWVLLPSYVQAVVWISAVTELLSGALSLTALLFALSAAGRDRIDGAFWAAFLAAGAAMFAHESTVTLFATIPLLVSASGQRPHRRVLLAAMAAASVVGLVFLATTVAANRQSYVFTEGHYAIGRQMWSHARDYVLSLYVGRHDWINYGCLLIVASLIIWRGTTLMRTGLVWLIVTMLPFLGFTWGNVGRYTYMPAIGFSWIVAGALVSLRDRLEQRAGTGIGRVTVTLLAIVVVGRFASFTRNAVKGEAGWMEAYRTYRDEVTGLVSPQALEVTVPPPRDTRVERDYIEPMLQWHTHNPALRVRIRDF